MSQDRKLSLKIVHFMNGGLSHLVKVSFPFDVGADSCLVFSIKILNYTHARSHHIYQDNT